MARPISIAQVATRFGKSASWMRRNIDRLQSDHGFPRCITGFGNIYDPVAIEAWLARQRGAEAPIAASPVRVAVDHDWATILDERAAALAPAAGHA